MWRLWTRRELWLEQRGDEKSMVWQFHGASLALHAARADAKSSGLKLLFVFFVHAVVAVVLLGVVFASTNGVKAGSRQDFQVLFPGGFGAACAAVRQATGKRSDDEVLRAGIVFRAVGVADLQNISRIL